MTVEVSYYLSHLMDVKMNFTIKDLSEGKCIIYNDGTPEELNELLQKVIPGCPKAHGISKYYYIIDNSWGASDKECKTSQSVKKFLEIERENIINIGDEVIIDNDYNCKKKYTFVAKFDSLHIAMLFEGSSKLFERYLENKKINQLSSHTAKYIYVNSSKVTKSKIKEVTMRQIAEAFNVDLEHLKIIDKPEK